LHHLLEWKDAYDDEFRGMREAESLVSFRVVSQHFPEEAEKKDTQKASVDLTELSERVNPWKKLQRSYIWNQQ
jgi:hypothetical protein